MPRSSSYNSRHKNSRDRDREYKRRSSSDDDYYERKRSHRRSRSPSSSSRSKLSYRSSRRRSNSSSENDYYRKKKSRNHKDKKSKKSKRSHRSPSTSSNSSVESTKSSSTRSRQLSNQASPLVNIPENENEQKKMYNLNLLERKVTTETLDDIETDKFEAKAFTSSNSNKQASQKVYIDLKKETITVPTSNDAEPINDSLFHPNFLGDEVEASEKWVKKLFNFRQRLLHT